MFVESFGRASGEPYRSGKPDIPSSKGYPARRDPQADNPKGILNKDLGRVSLRVLRNKYSAPGSYPR